jgi:hypothetical protein
MRSKDPTEGSESWTALWRVKGVPDEENSEGNEFDVNQPLSRGRLLPRGGEYWVQWRLRPLSTGSDF